MRVVQIAASDQTGGAAIAAYRLHKGLRIAGVDSRMIVREKRSDDSAVMLLKGTMSLFERLRRSARSRSLTRDLRRYRATLSPHAEYFSDDRASDPRALPRALAGDADIYHLHWVAGFLDYRTFFETFPRDKPLVWTLHDMNPFTGGCHYTAGCDKFTLACNACPVLGSKDSDDLASAIFRRKHAAYECLSPELVRIVATSRWLAAEAKKSALFRQFDVATIPYGLDTELFRPRNKTAARELFDIPLTCKIVMFAAQSLENYRKGIDLLVAALDSLDVPFDVVLVSVGSGRLASTLRQQHFPLGHLDGERLLSFAYSAADVFVTPAREEAFGQVVFEAMACGTPVVAFDVGGIPDMVRPGISGLLAPPNDVGTLREAIETLLANDDLRGTMAHECRRIAVEEYRLDLQAERYTRIYRELLAQTARVPSAERAVA